MRPAHLKPTIRSSLSEGVGGHYRCTVVCDCVCVYSHSLGPPMARTLACFPSSSAPSLDKTWRRTPKIIGWKIYWIPVRQDKSCTFFQSSENVLRNQNQNPGSVTISSHLFSLDAVVFLFLLLYFFFFDMRPQNPPIPSNLNATSKNKGDNQQTSAAGSSVQCRWWKTGNMDWPRRTHTHTHKRCLTFLKIILGGFFVSEMEKTVF